MSSCGLYIAVISGFINSRCAITDAQSPDEWRKRGRRHIPGHPLYNNLTCQRRWTSGGEIMDYVRRCDGWLGAGARASSGDGRMPKSPFAIGLQSSGKSAFTLCFIWKMRQQSWKRSFTRSRFRTSSSDTEPFLTFSLGLSVPTLRRFCRLRCTSTILYDIFTFIWYDEWSASSFIYYVHSRSCNKRCLSQHALWYLE